ncbi:MAG: glycosyltransferase family 2 protein [Cyanobacteria bacterium REEB459]|nr:glycosyltransferase family 2 protein [Cyanobacteria bacterium REEB459]
MPDTLASTDPSQPLGYSPGRLELVHPNPPACLTGVLVVIVNYRTPQLTLDCLQSLRSEIKDLPNLQVVVTDNNSGDGSDQIIATALAAMACDWIQFMPLSHNGGFAYGNNVPIRRAMQAGNLPPYVLLLNPDTIVQPGAIHSLVEFLEAHPEVGIAGSRLQDPDGTPQNSAFRFHGILTEIDGSFRLGLITKLLSRWKITLPMVDEPCQVQWVAGASMLIRRQVLEQIGLMDEGYFMYCEEMDFCLQAYRHGWSCWYVPASRVVHLVGQSSGVTDSKSPPRRLPKYVFDSRRRYFLKNYGRVSLLLADMVAIIGLSTWRIRRFLLRKPDNDPPRLLQDTIRNSCFLRGFHLSGPINS